MGHIEFTGISGVGKSTLYKRLLRESGYYGGSKMAVLMRDQPWPLNRLLPSPLRSRFLSRLWNQRKQRYYEQFVDSHPTYESLVASTDEFVDYEEQQMRELLVKTAARYQLGCMTVRDQERLILDEGFCHRAASMASRTETFDIPISEFIDAVPLPGLLVYVRAPDEIINQRRREREEDSHDLERLHQNRRFIDDLSECAAKEGVTVLEIENTGQVDDVASELIDRLEGKISSA